MKAIRYLFSATCLVSVGCASPMSDLRADNHRLSQTVSDLRADKRAEERKMRDLEHQLDEARAKAVSSSLDGSMPQLRVEVAAPGDTHPAPDGQRVVGVADDGAEIVYEGDAAAGKVATLDDDPPQSMPEPAHKTAPPAPPPQPTTHKAEPPPEPTAAARTTQRPSRSVARAHAEPAPDRGGDAGNDYRAAVDLLKAGKHDDAVAALRAFVQKYPHHDYADNAQYWLGEAFYVQKDYQRALVEFRATIETYPRGNKVPDALLKVGYCYQALGQADRAKAVLEQVVNLYPKSEPASLASKRLESM